MTLYFIINVHLTRLWKADYNLATLTKDASSVLFFMVANHVVQSENRLKQLKIYIFRGINQQSTNVEQKHII
jgi:hypothetical protein